MLVGISYLIFDFRAVPIICFIWFAICFQLILYMGGLSIIINCFMCYDVSCLCVNVYMCVHVSTCVYMCLHVILCVIISSVSAILLLLPLYMHFVGVCTCIELSAHSVVSHHCVSPIYLFWVFCWYCFWIWCYYYELIELFEYCWYPFNIFSF